MRRAIVILAGVACLLSQAAMALEANEIFKRADPSIVVITTADKNGKDLGLGSGVLVAPRDVVTNCHVVKDAATIVVKQPGVQRSGKLRYQDTARDLCQIQLDDALPGGKPVSAMMPSAKLEIGQPVFAIGAPQGLDRTLSRGIISALRDMKDNARLIQTDASVTHGSSGGGLFDSEGRLIGIVTFGIGEEGNLNFAIPTDWIEQLASRNRDRSADAAPTQTENAAAPASDGRWHPAKGDRWRYRLLDGKRPMGTVNIEVVESGSGRVRERITKDGFAGFSMEREVRPEFKTNAFEPQVTLPGGYQLLELSPYLPPGVQVEAGALSPRIPGNVHVTQTGVRNVVWSIRLVGREKVRVPAGEFDAWRIDASSSITNAYGEVRLRHSIWYSPAFQRAVKIHLATLWPVHTLSTFETLELASQDPGVK
jgi:serine protease Do